MPINKNQSTKRVKLDLKGLSPLEKKRAKEAAGRILVGEINNFLDESKSPVKSGKFKKNKADGERSILFEFGDMRDSIKFEPLDTDHIEVGIFEDSPTVERLKSYNHNVGDTLPQRRFIAAPNQKFKEPIMEKVDRAIDKIKEDSRQDLAELTRAVIEDVPGSEFFDINLEDILPEVEIG